MLSFRGIDNAGYYRLAPGQELHYQDFTGTGNTLNSESPVALRMIMDSLRYWAQECHVDGFRFGQASALARRDGSVDRASPLLEIISQDPVISGVKLIAEPWDAGPDGYWVGGFPRPWTEWNPRYRIEVRDFWRGASSCAPFATRVSGSEDLYAETERSPHASLNHITAHYGFTLRDLVSYNHKHNEANLEDNRDGSNSNHAWNCGVEGPTDDPAVLALRARQQRNLLTTLFVSQGVPMLLGGDELGRTQLGNNNAWCQDNEISWYDWGTIDSDLLAFTRRLTRLRSEHPVFRRSAFLRGSESDVPDVWWLRPDGSEMMVEDWEDSERRTLGMLLNGEPVGDDSFLLLFNAYWEDVAITLPSQRFGQMWAQELDTSKPQEWTYADYLDGASIELAARSILILRRVTAGPSSMRR
jgi:glycogen operon protein